MAHKLVRTGQKGSGIEGSGRAQPILWDVRQPSVGDSSLTDGEEQPRFLYLLQGHQGIMSCL